MAEDNIFVDTTESSARINNFVSAFNDDIMLVKNIKTRETKTIPAKNIVIRNPVNLSAFTVQDERIKPKYNFTKEV